ncbi:DUF1311 domain-containing protein [Salmonella enterica subsp. houtenae]|nr:DUF1311 domain-containing protein [Salmonella enterica subsp. houtenae]EAB2656269.1 DUF1311 domain-containing protein [Salmonella enterica]EDX2012616.1 DUF1311 domain-containing protein [Salmonella enterica subsp. enterica]EHB8804032.1 DUF1311 domain-containing protein [Salmonella enterica subsp. enterica serovar Rough O:z4,z23:-]EHP9585208.1 DUF1311 domain-containing protein [Salmonella enterica subsp. houtenae serovar 50:g,z51:-]
MKNYAVIILFIPLALQASIQCNNIQLSEQVFLCSQKAFEDSDEKLNETYKTLLSTIRKTYSPQPSLGSEFIEKVKTSQRAWVNFRDTNCIVYSFQSDEKSQSYETSMYSCKNDMTLKRIEELKSVLVQ